MHLTLAHSPDADDAFMFWPLAQGLVDAQGYSFTHVLADIDTLNRAALEGRYDLSALSFHAYPHVAGEYLLLSCGASVGDGYGPLVVVRDDFPQGEDPEEVAVPGELTTAYLALRLWRPDLRTRVLPFDRIAGAVRAGEVAAGLLIHEGQLTYRREGLRKIVDLGEWWRGETGLPLPLGGNVLHRRHRDRAQTLAGLLRGSIEYALAHRDEGVRYARAYARGCDAAEVTRFVGMYVNRWTLDLGPEGRRAVETLLARGAAAGLVPPCPAVDWVD
ncbi:MAG: ABC transporter substrate-binding protein [Firmicutes bacterium]|nr:ABC transporter substrate-binding protein [Bacillota bacterium]